MILNDRELLEAKPFSPMLPGLFRGGVISYGLGSFGYDVRLGYNFKELAPEGQSSADYPVVRAEDLQQEREYRPVVVDPKQHDERLWRSFTSTEPIILEPGALLLAETIERWDVPEDTLALVLGKSSYVRVGVLVLSTPAEPGWNGVLTLEITNLAPRSVLIYPGEGIAQVLFLRGTKPEVTYANRVGGGKYQGQSGVTPARVEYVTE